MRKITLGKYFKISRGGSTANEFISGLVMASSKTPKLIPVKDRKYIKEFRNVTDIETWGHTRDQWNDRVGPYMIRGKLHNYLKELILYNSYRLKRVRRDCYTIDDEIVMIIELSECKTIAKVLTFYGRLSLNPALYGTITSEFKKLAGGGKFTLDVNEDEVLKQELPALPYYSNTFCGTTHAYRLEVFEKIGGYEIHLYTKPLDKTVWYLQVLTANVKSCPANRVLTLLFELGYRKIVHDLIKKFKEEKYNAVLEEFGEEKVNLLFEDCYLKREYAREEVSYEIQTG